MKKTNSCMCLSVVRCLFFDDAILHGSDTSLFLAGSELGTCHILCGDSLLYLVHSSDSYIDSLYHERAGEWRREEAG